jgi:hypothetical protein
MYLFCQLHLPQYQIIRRWKSYLLFNFPFLLYKMLHLEVKISRTPFTSIPQMMSSATGGLLVRTLCQRAKTQHLLRRAKSPFLPTNFHQARSIRTKAGRRKPPRCRTCHFCRSQSVSSSMTHTLRMEHKPATTESRSMWQQPRDDPRPGNRPTNKSQPDNGSYGLSFFYLVIILGMLDYISRRHEERPTQVRKEEPGWAPGRHSMESWPWYR